MTLDISANGVSVLHQTFGSATDAAAYFTDHAVDLGSLNSAPYTGNTLALHVSLDVTSTGGGSGFYGDLLIGDPPPAPHAGSLAATQAFAQALSGFGAGTPAHGSSAAPVAGHSLGALPMLAPAAWALFAPRKAIMSS